MRHDTYPHFVFVTIFRGGLGNDRDRRPVVFGKITSAERLISVDYFHNLHLLSGISVHLFDGFLLQSFVQLPPESRLSLPIPT